MSDRPASTEGLEMVPFPRTVRAAGMIWIIFGSLTMLFSIISMLLAFVAVANRGAGALPGMCPRLLGFLFSAVFVHVGVQSIRGTARDALGNGIGSIVFGVLELGVSIILLVIVSQAENPPSSVLLSVGAGIYALCGVALLVAGVLALIGRSEYSAWRMAHRPPKRKHNAAGMTP